MGIPISDNNATYNETTSSNTSVGGINPFMILILGAIILIYIVLFSSLGKKKESLDTQDSGSTKIIEIILFGMFIALILLNGLQYFFNINLSAKITDLFTSEPQVDIIVQDESTDGVDNVAPIPEIKIKKQVFHIPGNTYNYKNADALCKAYGARLANYNEIEKAYKNGAEWCSYGWSDDQMALFPTQKKTWKYLQTVEGHENDCGRPGINGGFIDNENVRFGVNCYGYKPKKTEQEAELMELSSIYPKSNADVAQDKRIEYWRNKLNEIIVAPFNKSVWSYI
tara:strand:+ start:75 stop:923 length:849 start_codon:yes stop_codon:yes gene_type:complete